MDPRPSFLHVKGGSRIFKRDVTLILPFPPKKRVEENKTVKKKKRQFYLKCSTKEEGGCNNFRWRNSTPVYSYRVEFPLLWASLLNQGPCKFSYQNMCLLSVRMSARKLFILLTSFPDLFQSHLP